MPLATSSFSRDANFVPITQNGLIVKKEVTFTTDGTVVVPIFTLTGTVLVNALYGIVTTDLGSNHTAASWRINDQGAQVYLTASAGTTLSSDKAGSLIIKDGLVAAAVKEIVNTDGAILEPTTLQTMIFSPIILVKKTAALTQIEYRYITNNTSLGAITFYCGFIPLSEDGNLTVV
jgi:hypothetical protein